ncbi:MAG: hypothetical protein WD042_14755 [Phycisphaeraceae bacterium]
MNQTDSQAGAEALRRPGFCGIWTAGLRRAALIVTCLLLLLSPASRAQDSPDPHPPIPIRFTLDSPRYVTIVIDDDQGVRVRNLLAETPFDAGEHTVWWDGLDGADRRNLRSGAGRVVSPATYQARILTRDSIDLIYETALYNPGQPAWDSIKNNRNTGGWLADHSTPADVMFMPQGSRISKEPQLVAVAPVAEWGQGVMWVRPDGSKIHGKRWIGGTWTGAQALAKDHGPNREANLDYYSACGFKAAKSGAPGAPPPPGAPGTMQGELRIYRNFTEGGRVDQKVVDYLVPTAEDARIAGLAAHNGLLVLSLPQMNRLLFIDAKAGKIIGTLDDVPSPRGLAFDKEGRLLCALATSIVRYVLFGTLTDPAKLPAPETIVAQHLEDAQKFLLADDGSLYVCDRGSSNQIKHFAPGGAPGKLLGAIGKANQGQQLGRYDPLKIQLPVACAIDNLNQLWVCEGSHIPKRISVWSLDGKLLKSYEGPPSYGGGGQLDPRDRTIAYYATRGRGMSLKIDWASGAEQIMDVYADLGRDAIRLPGEAPMLPMYVAGRKYMTNVYNTSPTNGPRYAGVWLWREDGTCVPVALVGGAKQWKALHEPAIKALIPQGVGDPTKSDRLFAWSDLNLNGAINAGELTFHPSLPWKQATGDLSMRFTDGDGTRIAPRSFTAEGVPVFDATTVEQLLPTPPKRNENGSGGLTLLPTSDGWVVCNDGPMKGYRDGALRWTYPNPWPSLHSSHHAPKPRGPGDMVAAIRLIGPPVRPTAGDAGDVWLVNGNMGCLYAMTADGFFLGTLFKDERISPGRWPLPATRGMKLNDASNNQESFWPSVAQMPDGTIYLSAGGSYIGIVRVDGMDTVRRLPAQSLQVTADVVRQCEAYLLRADQKKDEKKADEPIQVLVTDMPITIDGKIDDWKDATWATIGSDTRIALRTDDANLYVVWRIKKVGPQAPIVNSGESKEMLFKTGGCLDLMLATDPKADPKRTTPAQGDLRLVATLLGDKQGAQTPLAMLYRPVVPGTQQPVEFRSPWRTVTIDRVDDVSEQIRLAMAVLKLPAPPNWPDDYWIYELAVPLKVLALDPRINAKPGLTLRGDVGLLQGVAGQTVGRTYWHNPAAGLTADVPGEAMLTPQLWGQWKFVAPAK